MKALSTALFLWFLSQPIFLKAQYIEFDWVKSMPIIMVDIKIDNEDNLYIIGSLFDTLFVSNQSNIDTITPQNANFVLIKLNPSGEPIWVKKFVLNKKYAYGKLETRNGVPSNMVINSKNEITLIFQTDSIVLLDNIPLSNQSAADYPDYFVMPYLLKFDKNGNLLKKAFIEMSGKAFRLAVDKQDNLLLCGSIYEGNPSPKKDAPYYQAPNPDNSSPYDRSMIMKIDDDWNFKWIKTFEIVMTNEHAIHGRRKEIQYVAIDDENNDVYFSGSEVGEGNVGTTQNPILINTNKSLNIFYGKLDKNGNCKWAKTLSGESWDYSDRIAIDKKKNLFISGYFSREIDFMPGGISTVVGDHSFADQAFILHADSAGNIINALNYPWSRFTNFSMQLFNYRDSFLIAGPKDFNGNSIELYNHDFKEIWSKKLNLINDSLYPQGSLMTNYHFGMLTSAAAVDSKNNVYYIGNHSSNVDFNDGLDSNIVHPKWALDHPNLVIINYPEYRRAGFLLKHTPCIADSTFLNVEDCSSFKAPSGKVFTSTDRHFDAVYSQNGCDSVFIIDLKILNTSFTLDTTVCKDFLAPDGSSLTKEGKYQFTLVNSSSCDSFLTINLKINDTIPPLIYAPEDITIYTDTPSCYINVSDIGMPNASDNCEVSKIYRNPEKLIKIGDNEIIWTAEDAFGNTASASQNVHLINNKYPFLTDCFKEDVMLFPNPNNGRFSVHILNKQSNLSVQVFRADGGKVHEETVYNIQFLAYDFSRLARGLYLIRFKGDSLDKSIKFIIQ